MLDGILQDDADIFWTHFKKMLGHSIGAYLLSVGNSFGHANLQAQTRHFANLSNFVASQGGAIKKNQALSGFFFDV